MSVYRVPLKDLDVDFFQLPVTCGGYAILAEFSWDKIAQRQYDNIQLGISTLQKSNPLVLVSALDNIVDNTDFLGYISSWKTLLDAFELYASKWVNELIYSPEVINWVTFLAETNFYLESFSTKYISFNHISKLNEFLVYIQAIVSAVTAEQVANTLSLLQDISDPLITYINQYAAYTTEVQAQFDELTELLYWSITVHFGEDSCTTALEIGSSHFDQIESFPKILFDSPLEKIGRRDLGSVMMWIGIPDGSQ